MKRIRDKGDDQVMFGHGIVEFLGRRYVDGLGSGIFDVSDQVLGFGYRPTG
jgi:hypothetical protein